VPRLEDLFENHHHLVWYESPGECLELIEHYLTRPGERARIARAGRAWVLAHRTYDHFARDLVDVSQGGEPPWVWGRTLQVGGRQAVSS
jgi:spore maturation protein CgeB